MTEKQQRTIFDIAMDNLKRDGVRKEDTLEYAIDQGRTTHKAPLTDEERERLRKNVLNRHSIAVRNEITRIYLRYFSKKSVDGIDGKELGDTLVECFNNQWSNTYKCFNLISERFGVDKKTAKRIAYVVTKQAMTYTNWRIAIDKGAVTFTLVARDSNEYEGQEFPIMDLPKYMGYIVENYGSPNFHYDKMESEELRKRIRLVKK